MRGGSPWTFRFVAPLLLGLCFAGASFGRKTGGFWIILGAHGAPVELSDAQGAAPLALGSRDMEDVFGILSVGSRVVIQR